MEIILVVTLATLVGTFLQRVSGMGLGLVAGPILSIIMGPVEGILVLNILAFINAIMSTWSVREWVDWKKFWQIAPLLIVGAIPAALLIREVSGPWLQVLVGSFLIIALAMVTVFKNKFPPAKGALPRVTAGIAGGFMNTLAGVAGPAITVYAQASRWEQRSFAATLQPIFIVSGGVSFLIKIITGAGTVAHVSPWLWVCAVAAMIFGIWFGKRVSDKVPRDKARALALTIAILGGVSLLVRGLLAL